MRAKKKDGTEHGVVLINRGFDNNFSYIEFKINMSNISERRHKPRCILSVGIMDKTSNKIDPLS